MSFEIDLCETKSAEFYSTYFPVVKLSLVSICIRYLYPYMC